ncbi:hypothetical protein BC827DRAFT_1241596, partial [Russula dissimulans]
LAESSLLLYNQVGFLVVSALLLLALSTSSPLLGSVIWYVLLLFLMLHVLCSLYINANPLPGINVGSAIADNCSPT